MSCFSPGWTGFGEAVCVLILPHLWVCSISCFALRGRFIASATSSKEGFPHTWVQGPILWTSRCCHWSLPLIILIHAQLLSSILRPPTSVARGLVHNFKDKAPLGPHSLFCLNLPCRKSYNSSPFMPVPGSARIKSSATETRCIWLGLTKQTHLAQGNGVWSVTPYKLCALNLLLCFRLEKIAPLKILCLVLNRKWSYHSILCLATEEKVGMATLFQHVKGCCKGDGDQLLQCPPREGQESRQLNLNSKQIVGVVGKTF